MAEKKKVKKKAESAEAAVPFGVVSESLAVTHRPRKFKDLVGQSHVVSIIKGMFQTKKFPGAILLEGQTGGGKTTVGRMIFSYLNCVTHNACGTCTSCQMGVKTHPDLITVDAGSEGGVDNIRRVVKIAKNSPMMSKRVILIDEAHKLTGASLEALLVPLEEPCASTIWILCTTEPEALKATVKNRCVRLVMRPIPKQDIVDRLTIIAKSEGVDLAKIKGGDKALEMIADFTNGSMREAIALLETVMYGVSGGGKIDDKDVLNAYIQNSEVDLDKAAAYIVAALMDEKYKAAISLVRKTTNMRGLLSKILWLLDFIIARETGTSKFVPYTGRIFESTVKEKKIEVKFATALRLLRIFVDANQDFNRTSVGESFIMHAAIEKYATD